jgi:hypothetical protein
VSLHWQPVGPLPAETYWRRRGGVAGAAVLLLLLLVWLWPGGDDVLAPAAAPTTSASPDPTVDPGADPSASPGATPTPSGGAEPCADEVLGVTASSDAQSYAVGARAALTLVIKNNGAVPCRRAVGQGAVELVVTSGEDRIWSSDDCAPGGDVEQTVLAPGAEQTAKATWSGTRSAPGCPEGQPPAQPGTYRVTARVGELRAPGASFQITG